MYGDVCLITVTSLVLMQGGRAGIPEICTKFYEGGRRANSTSPLSKIQHLPSATCYTTTRYSFSSSEIPYSLCILIIEPQLHHFVACRSE